MSGLATDNIAGAPTGYEALIRAHRLRPIRTEAELDRAQRLVNRLAVTAHLTRGESDYLDVLTKLIEAYEDEHYSIRLRKRSALGALKFLLKEHGMTGSDLGRLLGGPRQLGSAILRGARQLSKTHIRKLADRFRVDPSLFLD